MGDDFPDLFHGDRHVKVAGDGDGVAADHGNTDAGAGDCQIRQVHQLPAFVLHLHFFAGVAFKLFAADLGNQVECDLMGEDLGLVGLALTQGFHFVHQFNGTACTGTGNSLIGGGSHGADGGDLVQRIDSGDGDDGGAVGVGDDALVVLHILGVDLRNDQRHIGVQTECGGVIHEGGTGCHDGRGKPLGNVVFSSTQDDVHTLKGFIAGFLYGDIFAAELHGFAGASGAGQRNQLSHGEIPLLQNFHHFTSYGAGSAQDGNSISFHGVNLPLFILRNCYREPGWLR